MKIFLGLIAFIFISGAVFIGIALSKDEDPKVIRAYIDSRGKEPIPRSMATEIGRGI
ncbi:MAG: hypothetical protein IT290_03170 [Deltaproteobacteria bacterium]|jgi:hypothetical protein|nr:hypothetical protein [Deltaproteobacteria bacterium]